MRKGVKSVIRFTIDRDLGHDHGKFYEIEYAGVNICIIKEMQGEARVDGSINNSSASGALHRHNLKVLYYKSGIDEYKWSE